MMASGACAALACGDSTPSPVHVGQFGAYKDPYKQLRLSSGETLTVYRVKVWTFTDGSAPALQIEYESPVPVSDTVAVRQWALQIWPVLVSYLDTLKFSTAIITASNLRRQQRGDVWTLAAKSFGVIAVRDVTRRWRFKGDTITLPPADLPPGTGLFERDGSAVLVPHDPRAFDTPRRYTI